MRKCRKGASGVSCPQSPTVNKAAPAASQHPRGEARGRERSALNLSHRCRQNVITVQSADQAHETTVRTSFPMPSATSPIPLPSM